MPIHVYDVSLSMCTQRFRTIYIRFRKRLLSQRNTIQMCIGSNMTVQFGAFLKIPLFASIFSLFFTFRLWLVYFCWPLKDSQILLYCVFYLSQLHDVITLVLFEITFIILNSNSRRLSIGLKVIFCFFRIVQWALKTG